MPRKGQNIYKRKDGRWEGRYIKGRDIDGKPIRGYVYAKTYSALKEKLTDAIARNQTSNETQTSTANPFFETIAEAWFDTNRAQLKVSTQNKYRNLLNSYEFLYSAIPWKTENPTHNTELS